MRALLPPILFLLLAGLIIVGEPAQTPRSTVIDSVRLLDDLKVLSSDAMEGRRTGTVGSEKARAFIAERFKASGVVPFGASYEHAFTFRIRGVSGEQRGVNVVGRIDGAVEPRRYVVISAHYDHLGTRNGIVFNGADDNASGTAALFAIAKYFSSHPPRHTLIFVAFDAEEAGLLGSQAFVRQPPVDVQLLSLNLNLDMIGRDPDRKLFVVGTARQPFLRPVIEAVAKNAPVRLLMGHENPAEPEDWTADSDHYSFIQAKIPALYFGVEDFKEHHEATDDFESMTLEFYVKAVEALVEVVERFDTSLESIDKARAAARQ